ncbi:MAG: hypothetical protein ACKV2V_28965 [Blastocatellia bacterium]
MLLALFALTTPAQAPDKPRAANDEKQERRARAVAAGVSLLGDLPPDIQLLRLPENRARAQMGLGLALWTRDQKKARQMFRAAAASVREILGRNSEEEDAQDNSLPPDQAIYFKMRSDLLNAAAERDAEFAMELLALSKPPAQGATLSGDLALQMGEAERDLEFRLAMKAAAKNPRHAADLAMRKLSDDSPGAVEQALEALDMLRGRDSAQMSRLGRSVLEKIGAQDENGLWQSMRLLQVLLGNQPYLPAGLPIGEQAQAAAPEPDESLIRGTLEQIAARMLATPKNDQGVVSPWVSPVQLVGPGGLGGGLKNMLPLFEKYLPARAQAMRTKFTEMEKAMPAELRGNIQLAETHQRIGEMLRGGNFDGAMANIQKLPRDAQPQAYAEAAEILIGAGDMAGADRLIEQRLGDSPLEPVLRKQMDAMKMQQAISSGKTQEARQRLDGVRSVRERVDILIQLSQREQTAGHGEEAGKLLEEAAGLVPGRAANRSQLELQLKIAMAMAGMAPRQALDQLENTVGRLNELVAASVALDGFMPPFPMRDGELIVADGEYSQVSALFRQLAEALAPMMSEETERAAALIGRLSRPELRVAVRLTLVENLLGVSAAPERD